MPLGAIRSSKRKVAGRRAAGHTVAAMNGPTKTRRAFLKATSWGAAACAAAARSVLSATIHTQQTMRTIVSEGFGRKAQFMGDDQGQREVWSPAWFSLGFTVAAQHQPQQTTLYAKDKS